MRRRTISRKNNQTPDPLIIGGMFFFAGLVFADYLQSRIISIKETANEHRENGEQTIIELNETSENCFDQNTL